MTVLGIRQSAKELLEIDHYKPQQPETDDQILSAAEKGKSRALDADESAKIKEDHFGSHDIALASLENDGQDEHDVRHDDEHRAESKWLGINLVICTITVYCMFVAGPIELAFATLMQDDIKDDDVYRSQCTEFYVWPWNRADTELIDVNGKCDFLLAWTYVMQVAGSFSLIRTLCQALPIFSQNYWTLKYREGGWFDRFITPARSYAIRTFFAAGAFVLHIVSAVMLGVSPVINDKEPAAEEYQLMFRICLGIICACTLVTGQQTFATGIAAWRLRSSRKEQVRQI